MTWLDAPKSEHIVRREHYVAGREDERERIVEILKTIGYVVLLEEDENGDIKTMEQEELIAMIEAVK
ncbi:MAG: hypothetical protein EBR82_61605 [Caulobacteraceae bacterium]|nr:hypothetical protein [Caulobacteraceae bacterium]NBX24170.1 hypothetical protein [Microbacteriaceae bacterium]